MSSDERQALLALTLVPGLGPQRLRRLRSTFGTAVATVAAGPARWGEVIPGLQRFAPADLGAARRALERAARLGGSVLSDDDERYPRHFATFSDLPPLLYLRGAWPEALAQWPPPAVAIVGTRRPDPQATAFAFDVAQQLARAGVSVISGLAYGIDAAAHRGALEAGAGSAPTLAVVAGGVDRPGPSGNLDLAREIIASGGALVSEMAIGSVPQRGAFPRRNRLVAALARAVLVVAAGRASGAHLTAGHAARYGRDVCVVPARPWDAGYAGNLALLHDGATPVCGLDEALELLTGAVTSPAAAGQSTQRSVPAELDWLWAELGPSPVALTVLVERCGRGVAATLAGLEHLVACGMCRVDGERNYRRR